MTPLREKFIRDLKLKNYSKTTIRAYVRAVERFARLCKRSPALLKLEEIKQQLYFLKENCHISLSYYKQTVSALRYLYEHTLQRPWITEQLSYPRSPQTIPEVAAAQEIRGLIEALPEGRIRMAVTFLFATAMRLNEALSVKVSDIDSARMIIHVRCGKGGKQREVPLSKKLLEVLRSYYRLYRPKEYLFEDRNGRRLHDETVQRACREASLRAKLHTPITPHVLRHSAATSMLERGTDVRIIKELLGHSSLETTLRYTHVSRRCHKQVCDPLETIAL